MDSGLYAAYTGLLARTQALDTASNNLANTNTAGFRVQHDYFRGMLAMPGGEPLESQMDGAVNNYGVLGGNMLNMAQGDVTATGNPLDLAISGNGLFAVQTAMGRRYTRDGSFLRGADGTLTTARGEPVLNTEGDRIVLPDGAIQIAGNGTVSISTPDGSQIAGMVGLFDFDAADLSAEGTNRFRVHDGAVAKTATGEIEQGKIEGANQDVVHGTMQLMLIQRQAEMMQKALSVFNNDLDKTAAEELGRV